MFTLTEELKTQIAAHNRFMLIKYTDKEAVEPTNPWPAILEQMKELVKDIPCGWSSADEYCVDYLQQDYSGPFYFHLKGRYQMRAWDADTVCELLTPFAVLRDFT